MTARLSGLDQARGVALVAMASYHFIFDLDLFGLVLSGTALSPYMRGYAIAIAGSFLFLSGLSMVVAHGVGRRWPAFWRRWGILVAAAAAVSVTTYFAFGAQFVFWGILHMMAAASLVGIVLLGRVPAWGLAVLGILALGAGIWLRLPALEHPIFWITGAQAARPVTVDYLPILPWIGPYLLGMAWAQFARDLGRPIMPQKICGGALGAGLVLLGRNSLAFYLIHQPVLLALVGGYVWLLDYAP